ncbi:helix-turn-helix domain-containing protein [Ruminococcus sp. OA3]|uniref:helix-turn-helix domain-containing protein n=1 Tax=Ruminococcus sp. OA3 TaxID=2914164 RepID=UPI001F060680|nr:helix-turn-helix transcriptional regulator [Ruminococcus sp. OA3]MCH1981190.1 helix-turn-helix domain-containing protein [Ruminococcus sp. OA3]
MKCKVIKAFRKANNLSIEEFAELIGCSPKSVWRWENGICTIGPRYQRKVAKILGISIDDLYEEEED